LSAAPPRRSPDWDGRGSASTAAVPSRRMIKQRVDALARRMPLPEGLLLFWSPRCRPTPSKKKGPTAARRCEGFLLLAAFPLGVPAYGTPAEASGAASISLASCETTSHCRQRGPLQGIQPGRRRRHFGSWANRDRGPYRPRIGPAALLGVTRRGCNPLPRSSFSVRVV